VTRQSTRIVNKLGLHARPSALLVNTAGKFSSEIHVSRDELRVNAKSIMGVMMLAAEKGVELVVEADGPDETDAVAAVIKVIESGFGEEIG
jgi:phosphocarrier protein HPr